MRGLSHHPAKRGRTLDPRAVLLSCLMAILAVKGLHSAVELGSAAGLMLLVVLALGIPPRAFLKASLWVLPLCLAALPLVFTVAGPAALALPGGWTMSGPGLQRFGTITAQCLLCLQLVLVASSVCGPFALVSALGNLGCPQRLVAVLRLCLRYMDLLGDELERLQRARLCRGCGGESSLAFRARVSGQLVGTLFLRSLDRAERVEFAMRSRGSSTGPPPSREQPGAWGVSEAVVMGLAVAFAGISWTW